MLIGTGISLWRYLAQNQVNIQTHAKRRIICLCNYEFLRIFGLFNLTMTGLGFTTLSTCHATVQCTNCALRMARPTNLTDVGVNL